MKVSNMSVSVSMSVSTSILMGSIQSLPMFVILYVCTCIYDLFIMQCVDLYGSAFLHLVLSSKLSHSHILISATYITTIYHSHSLSHDLILLLLVLILALPLPLPQIDGIREGLFEHTRQISVGECGGAPKPGDKNKDRKRHRAGKSCRELCVARKL